MSTLIVQLPAPPRLGATEREAETPAALPAELSWVLSPDGLGASQSGRSAPGQWPAASALVAVLPPQAVAWHRLTLPKAPPARLRAALAGLLEESLLDDEADLHLALGPGAKAGEPAWVAAVDKAWLSGQIEALEATGATVERLVPAWPPEGPAAAHVFHTAQGDRHELAWRDEQGAVCLPADEGSARAWLARQVPEPSVHWSADPESADQAAQLAGSTVEAPSSTDTLLAAARWDGNLRQFDLVPRHRGSRLAREAWRRAWQDRAWRPVRWGLLALLLVQLVGLNLWAWQQRQGLARQKAAMTSLLQTTFPQVRAVIDAPAQMQKEIELLRAAAGRPGDTDLEPLLQAANSAWPPSRGPAESLRYEPGRLTVAASGWTPAEVAGFQQRLRPLGLGVDVNPGRLVLRRLAPGEAAPAAPAGAAAPQGPGTPPPTSAGRPGGPTAPASPTQAEPDPDPDAEDPQEPQVPAPAAQQGVTK